MCHIIVNVRMVLLALACQALLMGASCSKTAGGPAEDVRDDDSGLNELIDSGGPEADLLVLDAPRQGEAKLDAPSQDETLTDTRVDVDADAAEPLDLHETIDEIVSPPLPEVVSLQLEGSQVLGLSVGVLVKTNVPTTLGVTLENMVTGGVAPIAVPSGFRTEHSATVLMMRPDRLYRVNVEATDSLGRKAQSAAKWSTPPLPQEFPVLNVLASQPDKMAPGLTLVSLYNPYNGTGMYFLLSPEGEVVFYNLNPIGFVVPLPNGNLLSSGGAIAPLCEVSLTGSVVFCTTGSEMGVTTFHHMPGVTPEGNFLSLGLEIRPDLPCQINGSSNFVVDVLSEFTPTGESIRTIKMFDSIGLDWICDPLGDGNTEWDMTFPEYAPTVDRTHGNSVLIDPFDGNYVVSFLRLGSVFKVNRYSGERIWALGGSEGFEGDFALVPGGRWSSNHHSAVPEPNQRILLYDNRPSSPPYEARVVQYEYNMPSSDRTTWTAEQTWEYTSNPPILSSLITQLGEVHRLENDNVLVVDAAIYAWEAEEFGFDPENHVMARVTEVTYPVSAEVFQVEMLAPAGMPFGYWALGARRLTTWGDAPP